VAESIVCLPVAISDVFFAKEEDVSLILAEWESCLLDPVELLLEQIPRLASIDEWKVRGRALVSASAMKSIRAAAADERLIKALSGVIPKAVSQGKLRPHATPLLLGMAVSASIHAGVGIESRRVAKLLKETTS
jgi:hypothetical protein